jgi:1,4-dihydroxy-2-naphthoyl-CoA hydrolase
MLFPPSITLSMLNATSNGTLIEHLGIEYTALNSDALLARMPVDQRTKQPMGLLHGGASVVLAETVGSMAANLVVDREKYFCVGLEINANHVRKATDGYVYAEAKPLHLGKATHVWQIHITDEEGKLICISRHTVAVIEK